MKQTNRAIRAAKRYLREVRRDLPCSLKTKREMLSRLEESLLDFVGERPHATYEDITGHFGHPCEVADAYFADLPAEQLRKDLHTARFVRRVLITVLVIAALAYGMTLGIVIYENHIDGSIVQTYEVNENRINCFLE
ncbi:MAG: hypothetical protein E7553_00930 [Ruminococcaceae bacterium]|nr:hypothetical protein [Oscillospiraceae bacterium]